jgi:phosphatidylglycerol---prolipoprotein diacylglyceryl transferase
MIDDHSFPSDWGVRPILFHLSGFDVPAYPFFVTVGLVVGLSIYAYESRRKRSLNENGIFIAVGSLTGGILGAKLLELVLNYKIVVANIADPGIWLSGRTIVGGLIGGTIGAMLTKRVLGIKERRGNLFAPAVAMGSRSVEWAVFSAGVVTESRPSFRGASISVTVSRDTRHSCMSPCSCW